MVILQLASDADVKIDPRAADFPASLRPRGSMSTGAIVPGSSAAHRSSDQPLLAPDAPIELCEFGHAPHQAASKQMNMNSAKKVLQITKEMVATQQANFA